ncbi:RAxF-45 family protein [Vagococcus silagei]
MSNLYNKRELKFLYLCRAIISVFALNWMSLSIFNKKNVKITI